MAPQPVRIRRTGTEPPYHECIAISKTSTRLAGIPVRLPGAHARFNDYPHIGVWPDGFTT